MNDIAKFKPGQQIFCTHCNNFAVVAKVNAKSVRFHFHRWTGELVEKMTLRIRVLGGYQNTPRSQGAYFPRTIGGIAEFGTINLRADNAAKE